MTYQQEGEWNGEETWECSEGAGETAAVDYGTESYDTPNGGGGGDRACHVCGEDGHFAKECPQKTSRSNVCYNCNGEGHISRDCLEPPKSQTRACHKCNEEGHIARECPNAPAISCRKCNEEGHMARECPNAPPMNCRKCGEEGHLSRECPSGIPDKCFNCYQEGHLSRDCPEEKRERRPMTCHRCQQEGHRANECTNEAVERLGEDGAPLPAPVTYIPTVEEVTDANFDMLYYHEANISRFDTMTVTVSDPQFEVPMTNFEDAQLSENLMQTLRTKMRYSTPTPIQKSCIPIILAGRDVIACSQTGSGKSAAFILPILQNLMNDTTIPSREEIRGQRTQNPLVVVLSPTRELCLQLYEHFRLFSEEFPRRIGISPAYGGTQVRNNSNQIRSGTHVLCAVPGRLKQFVDEKTISFSQLRYLVLDEADRMLDHGFQDAIQAFNEHESMVPKEQRQTLMFSATFSKVVEDLARQMMRPDTVKVVVGVLGGVNSDVAQEFVETPDNKSKREALKLILDNIPGSKSDELEQLNGTGEKVMVFVEKKKNADILAAYLNQSGFGATTMHGDRDQQQREEALRTFRTGKHAVLVATEVAARGLDIKGVGVVINYDLPKDIDKFVHRVGRTGRVGTQGRAVSFFDAAQDESLAAELVKVLNECGQEVPDFISRAAAGGFTDDYATTADGDDTNEWGNGEWDN